MTTDDKDLILTGLARRVLKATPLVYLGFVALQLTSQGVFPLLYTAGEMMRSDSRFNGLSQLLLNAALNAARVQFPKNDVRTAQTLCGLSNLKVRADNASFKDTNLDAAMVDARAAMNMCTAMFGVDNPTTNRCLATIALIYRARGDSQQALKTEQRVLKTCQELYGSTHVSVANKLEDISVNYRDNGNLDLAVQYQNQSLKVRQALWGQDSRYTVQDLIELGDAYNKLGASEHGLSLYMRALGIVEKQPDSAGEQGSRIKEKIAQWYFAHHDYDQAKKWWEGEVVVTNHLKEETLKNQLLPIDYEGLGRSLVMLKQYDAALKQFDEAGRAYKKTHGQRSEFGARLQQWMARAYEGKGENQKAVDCLEEAIKTYDDMADDGDIESVYESDGWDAQSARYAHANLLIKLGESERLIERLHKLLKQQEDEAVRSRTLQLLYTLEARSGKFKSAAESHDRYLDSLVALREDSTSVKTTRDFRWLRSTGEARLAKLDLYGAIDALRKAARLGDQLTELEDRELCEVLSTLASCEVRAEKFSEAEEHLNQARKLAEQEYRRTQGRSDTAYTLATTEWCTAADYLMTVGKYDQSIPHFKRALDVLRKLEAHRKDLFVCLRDYAACQRLLGNVEEAQKAEKEAESLKQETTYDIHRAGECVAMHSGEGTFRLVPTEHAQEQILLGPVNLTEALYEKTLGDQAKAGGNLKEARRLYTRALDYLKVLQMDETVYAAPIKKELATLP